MIRQQFKKTIIFDTCILQYLQTKYIERSLVEYISDLYTQKFKFEVSQISICELLSGADEEKEIRGLNLLDDFYQHSVDSNILLHAARLTTLYTQEKIPNNQISLGDRIIASTAILNNSLILTADVNDFPRPFFKEYGEKMIFYKRKGIKKMLVVQLLQPNLKLILEKSY